MGTNTNGGKFKWQIYDRSLLDSSIIGTLSINLAKSWRNSEYDRECVKHSPRIGALISTAKFQRFRRSLYRALLTKNRKTSWVAASSVHPRHHAHTRRTLVRFHVPQSSRFIYHRFDVSTPFGYRSRKTHPKFLPHSVPMRPLAPIFLQDVRVITGRVDEQEKKDGSESIYRSSIAISL